MTCRISLATPMNLKSAILFLCPLALCLSSCFLFNDDEWRTKYGTPELLLENAGDKARVYLNANGTEDGAYGISDEDKTVRDVVLSVGPFTSIEPRQPTSCRYFTYEALWTPATSGPNYERLSIWEDGLARIHHKYSLGPHVYLCFALDKEKALGLVDFVFSYRASDGIPRN